MAPTFQKNAFNLTGVNLTKTILSLVNTSTKVTIGGDQLNDNLKIGTQDNYDLALVTNNVARMTIESTGSVFVSNQLKISGTASAPGLCSSLSNSTGLYFPTPNNVNFVGGGNILCSMDNTKTTINTGVLDVGLNGPSLTTSALNFILSGTNRTIQINPTTSTGLQLSYTSNDLNLTTTTNAGGTVQFRANGRGNINRPQYSFVDKTNTGLFLGNDGYLGVCQDGYQVLRCLPTGVNMGDAQIFFNRLPGPTYYPQICFGVSGSGNTGLYAPDLNVIRTVNNGIDALYVNENVVGHSKAHNASTTSLGSTLPLFESRAHSTPFVLFQIIDFGATGLSLTNLTINMMYSRVGNVCHGMGTLIFSVPSGSTKLDGLTIEFDLPYSSVDLSIAAPGGQSFSGTATLTDDPAEPIAQNATKKIPQVTVLEIKNATNPPRLRAVLRRNPIIATTGYVAGDRLALNINLTFLINKA
jgi:hypothetical protein